MIDIALQIFFLLNPLTAIPILFLAYYSKFNLKSVAFKAFALAFATAVIFVFVGPILFGVFSITTDSFKAAGGIMIMLLGLSMARESGESEKRKVTQADALVSILATPLLTGPATLSYLAIKTAELGIPQVLLSLSMAFSMVGAVLIFSVRANPNLNLKYVSFISRIFGLFLLALGLQMLVIGVKSLIV